VLTSLKEPLRDPKFRRVIVFSASFNAAIQLAGPYFAYYFTKELGIGMSSVATWAMATNLGAFTAAGFWGARLDRVGGARTIVRVCAALIGLSPLWYLSSDADVIRWIGGIDYFVNGMAWSGFTLSMTTLAIRHCPPGKNAAYFSVYSACNGLASGLAALLGGSLAQWLEPWGGFRALWVVASCLRFAVLIGLFGVLAPLWPERRR
jgi:MFS family permease